MRKIKVAHILHTYLPVTENWIYNQILFNGDCDPLVIAQFQKNEMNFPVKTLYSACPHKVLENAFSYFSRMKFWPPQAYYQSLINRENPDIIHGHFSTESWRVLSAAQKWNIPLVTNFYGLDVNKLPKRKYWKKRYSILFEVGQIFIVEGHHMAERLADIGCDPEKIRIVHIGIDIERIRKKLENRNLFNSVFKILFVGLEREKKGSMDAAEAFCRFVKDYDNAELHLVGNGMYKRKIEKILEKSGCLQKAFFHGFVDVDRYHELLAGCDILLAPSCTAKDGDTEGGAPVVCIEAQAAGKPVVATEHCDIPEIVLQNQTGLLCDEHNIERLTQNLLFMAKNPDQRVRMGEQGYLHVQRNHSIKKQVNEISSIYQSIISERN